MECRRLRCDTEEKSIRAFEPKTGQPTFQFRVVSGQNTEEAVTACPCLASLSSAGAQKISKRSPVFPCHEETSPPPVWTIPAIRPAITGPGCGRGKNVARDCAEPCPQGWLWAQGAHWCGQGHRKGTNGPPGEPPQLSPAGRPPSPPRGTCHAWNGSSNTGSRDTPLMLEVTPERVLQITECHKCNCQRFSLLMTK